MSKEVSSRKRVQARVKMTGREREEKWAEMRSEVKDSRKQVVESLVNHRNNSEQDGSHWKDLGRVSHDRT